MKFPKFCGYYGICGTASTQIILGFTIQFDMFVVFVTNVPLNFLKANRRALLVCRHTESFYHGFF